MLSFRTSTRFIQGGGGGWALLQILAVRASRADREREVPSCRGSSVGDAHQNRLGVVDRLLQNGSAWIGGGQPGADDELFDGA